ncbi:MAG: transglutaminase-like domain-containing protein [Tannerella sp.]|nr:transglutaminase-like domain-containing protein [Tannerella sp.]
MNKKRLISDYHSIEDSLKRKAVVFLFDNMAEHTSDIPGNIWYRRLPDSEILDNEFLTDDIDLAFRLWNKYPWADSVPVDIFMNYLLPYKVYGEEPSNWRSFFHQKYKDSLVSFMKTYSTDDIKISNNLYYVILVDEVGSWFKYSSTSSFKARHPGLNELMETKSADCYGWSYLNVMILRSLGIPSAIDFLPLWGRKNGSHYTEVFWDNKEQKFRTASGRELYSPEHSLYPAKVFRFTYKNQSLWKDSIAPHTGQEPFVLECLKNNHLKDVTDEHAQTATIDIRLNTTSDFAYICVFNYGEWHPVYWGRKQDDNTFRFENMGVNVMYRIAVPKGSGYEIASPIFICDSTGNHIHFSPCYDQKIEMSISKLNTGKQSWVEKGKIYGFYYLDEKSDWRLLNEQSSPADSTIIFENAPSGTLYLLQDKDATRRLARPFTYDNGKQIFW